MKTENINIKVITPYNEKINVVQRIPKDSQNPITTAFYYFIENKDKRYSYELCGEGMWDINNK
tara:strand:- start:646 stop:834 length:189 start_codon:yes stop_codon:yes gene_type:complete